jgi:hypothetical protein
MMRRLAAAVLTLVASARGAAQSPNTDVFLAPLRHEHGTLIVGAAVNVTHRAGYDNQPAFLPDSRAILYTAIDSTGRADIWRYDIADRRTTRVTHTPESEYSPTPIPGESRFSVIRVELDSTQRLWSFALDGSDPHLVLRDIKPVGYHVWLDSSRLALFVLGIPATLHYVNRDGSGDSIAVRGIGRSINLVPGRRQLSYTVRVDDAAPSTLMLSPTFSSGGIARTAGEVPQDNEFHTWAPDGTLLTASNGVLLRWNGAEGDVARWIPVADLTKQGVRNVSRLAVSPDGRWLAFVAEPVASTSH